MQTDYSALTRTTLERSCLHLQYRVMTQEQALAEQEQALAKQQAALADKEAELAALAADRQDLADRLALLQRELFGPKSEQRRDPTPGQLSFLDATVTTDDEAQAAVDPEPETEVIPEHRRKKRSRSRDAAAPELPRQEILVRVPEEERVGPNGEALVSNGFEVTEVLHHVPEKLVILVIKREKLAVAATREYVCTADAPARLIPGARASDAFMLQVTLQKYAMGLPLYRQLQHYRAMGADLADNYLGECVRHIAAAFTPIAAAIREQVLQAAWVYADETTIKQLKDPDQSIRTAYLWAWVGNKQVSFHYGTTRSAKEVRDQLGIPYDPDDPLHGANGDHDPSTWEHGSHIGFVICDSYSGYHPVFRAGAIARVACWVHARRRFYQMRDRDKNAAAVTQAINTIFAIDKKIRKAADKKQLATGSDARHTYIASERQTHIPPLISQLDQLLTRIKPYYTPDSVMSQAIVYIRNCWQELQVFLQHGFLPMENNTAERAVRPIAVGRKAWLFVGSEDGGSWAATLFSIIESCRLQKLDPYRYCDHVLQHIVNAPDRSTIDYAALTPANLRQELRGK